MKPGSKLRLAFDSSALDPHFRSHAGRGIGRYVAELVRYLEANTPEWLELRRFDHTSSALPTWCEKVLDWTPKGKMTLRRQVFYPIVLGRQNVDALHIPAHMDAPSWCPKPLIITVLDLIPLVCEQLYRPQQPGWRFELARWFENTAIKRAKLLLTISECSKRDIVSLLGIPPDRIFVTPLGVDESFFAAKRSEDTSAFRAKYGIPQGRPILLYVGGIDPRKNIPAFLTAFRSVISLSEEKPVLVLAGRIERNVEYPALLKQRAELGLENDVVLPGFVPDADLLSLMAEATLFAFPSLYEGFGLPVLEAMAAGLPVACSENSSLPEVLPETRLTFDPNSIDSMVETLLEGLKNKSLRTTLAETGRAHARRYTWERTGRLTVETYARLAQEMNVLN